MNNKFYIIKNTKKARILKKYLNFNNDDYNIAISLNRKLPLFILEKICKKLPLDVLEKLYSQNGYCRLSSIVINKKCPAYILNKLSDSNLSHIKEAIASNVNCPVSILNKLSEDKDYIVRVDVASNVNCPDYILEKLSSDIRSSIILKIVRNKNATEQVLIKIYNAISKIMYNMYICSLISANDNCPFFIIDETINNIINNYSPFNSINNYSLFNSINELLKTTISSKTCTFEALKILYKKYDDKNLKEIITNHPNWKLTEFT